MDNENDAVERARAINESVEAHADATGHDEVQMVKQGRTLNVVVVVQCGACGAQLGTIAGDAKKLADAFEQVADQQNAELDGLSDV